MYSNYLNFSVLTYSMAHPPVCINILFENRYCRRIQRNLDVAFNSTMEYRCDN